MAGLAALTLFVLQTGFIGAITPILHWCTVTLVVAFAAEQAANWLLARNRRQYARQWALHLAIAAAALAGMIAVITAEQLRDEAWKLSLLAHAMIQGAILSALCLRALRHQARLTAVTLQPGWLLMGSFGVLIVAGAALLKMPRAVIDGAHLSWLDALFTSTSAVCVTGLAVENTAHFFSPTGQIILLGLIQVGGLGIMTLTFFVATMLFEGMSLHDRMLLGEMISEKRMAHVSGTLRFIILFTLVTEFIGAVALYLVLPADHPPGERAFQAVFHSISAFCNAGFSTLPDGLADAWVRNNVALQLIVAALIVAGGLGSLALRDSLAWIRGQIRLWRRPDQARPRLRVHTRLVLTATGILLIGGTVVIYGSEFLLYRGETNAGQLATAFFHSVTSRTAGFNTVDMGQVGPVTIHVLVLLMLIGGSPGGTAGGVRTTVVAVTVAHLWNQLRSTGELVLFRRRMPPDLGSRALAVLVMAVGWLFVSFAVLRQVQPGTSDTRLVFELVSAFATVGLSLNLTPELTLGAKIVIILNMFVGRIGLLTVASTLIPPTRRKPRLTRPQEDILLV